MKNIIIIGSVAYDYIMDFPNTFEENILPTKLKKLSVSFLVNNFSKNFGGSATNIAYNLSLFEENPILLACAGQKDFSIYNKHLKKVGVNTDFVNVIKNEFTASVFLITDKKNCQIAAFHPGPLNSDIHLKIEDVIKKQKVGFLVISPTAPLAMKNFVLESKKFNIPYLYDPAQQIPTLEKNDLIEGIVNCEILICNDYEFSLILKKTGLTKNEILKKVKVLIITLGEQGSLIETKNEKLMINIVKPQKVVDPTGAGDAYIAGFLAGYLENKSLKICGQLGATIATYAIENYGTQKHKPSFENIKERYRLNFKDYFDF